MNIRFKIHYKTEWGQSLKVLLQKVETNEIITFDMYCNEKSEWRLDAVVPDSDTLEYQYA